MNRILLFIALLAVSMPTLAQVVPVSANPDSAMHEPNLTDNEFKGLVILLGTIFVFLTFLLSFRTSSHHWWIFFFTLYHVLLVAFTFILYWQANQDFEKITDAMMGAADLYGIGFILYHLIGLGTLVLIWFIPLKRKQLWQEVLSSLVAEHREFLRHLIAADSYVGWAKQEFSDYANRQQGLFNKAERLLAAGNLSAARRIIGHSGDVGSIFYINEALRKIPLTLDRMEKMNAQGREELARLSLFINEFGHIAEERHPRCAGIWYDNDNLTPEGLRVSTEKLIAYIREHHKDPVETNTRITAVLKSARRIVDIIERTLKGEIVEKEEPFLTK